MEPVWLDTNTLGYKNWVIVATVVLRAARVARLDLPSEGDHCIKPALPYAQIALRADKSCMGLLICAAMWPSFRETTHSLLAFSPHLIPINIYATGH